jgi:hypothetical protein
MKIKVISCNNGTTQYHAESCKHLARNAHFPDIEEMEFNASSMKELFHLIEIQFNNDFASDEGMTPQEYVASGLGEKASFDPNASLQVFRCIKFTNKKEGK